jgi:hypothetical protein
MSDEKAPDHESTAEFTPVVTGLKEIQVEHHCDVLYKQRCQLYRFNKTNNAWIQRGLG